MNRTDRLYAIVEELRAAQGRPVSAARLAARFEVSGRTIERDLSALQQTGVPIYAEPGRTGGYVLDGRATLPPVNFTPLEATAVAVALARDAASPFAGGSRSALLKLLQAMPAPQAARARELVDRVRLIEREAGGPGSAAHEVADGRIRGQLAAAIERHVVTCIDYVDRHGALSTRAVEPVGLLSGPRGWYLLGWCRVRDAGRVFRLDRVRAVRLSEERAPQRQVEDVFGSVPGLRMRAPELG